MVLQCQYKVYLPTLQLTSDARLSLSLYVSHIVSHIVNTFLKCAVALSFAQLTVLNRFHSTNTLLPSHSRPLPDNPSIIKELFGYSAELVSKHPLSVGSRPTIKTEPACLIHCTAFACL
jgi:hypothetical protein